MNNLLAGVSGYYNSSSSSVQHLRVADSAVRSEIARKAASAGTGVSVSSDIKYTTGPDGKLYATGGTITTTRRISGTADEIRDLKLGIADPDSHIRESSGDKQAANDNITQQRDFHLRPPTLAELSAPQINLSPLEFAKLQEQQQRDEGAKQQFISKLKAADIGVRTHEAQHFFVGAGLTEGTPEYDYVEGPDGRFYAVGGQVNLKTSGSSNPEDAAREADALARAATAPGDVSAQDVSVDRSSSRDAAALYSQALYATNQPVINLVG